MSNTVTSDQIAVMLAISPYPSEFPRPDGWTPKASLRLLAESARRQDDLKGPRWCLSSLHRTEDAGTADVRSAKLFTKMAAEPRDVVVKFERSDPTLNIKKEAIKGRFNREQRLLRDLSDPDEFAKLDRSKIPTSWTPAGDVHNSSFALQLESPVLYCLAADQAIPVEKWTDREEQNAEQLLRAVAVYKKACGGCAVYERLKQSRNSHNRQPIPPECKPWLVAARLPVRWEGEELGTPPTSLLILSDMGKSLQNSLDRGTADGPGAMWESFRAKLAALQRLAQSLDAIHQGRLLHLDLNPDNICILWKDDQADLRIIDFGHAEKSDRKVWGIADVDARIPLRRTDFAAPEMQTRTFPLMVCAKPRAAKDRQTPIEFEALGLDGLPRNSWPHVGDLLELRKSHDNPDKNFFQVQAIRVENDQKWMAVRPWPEPSQPYEFANQGKLDATVYRSPGPAADVYSFGLLLLCWLTGRQKPGVLRDELAVFEQAIPTVHEDSDPSRPVQLNDRNWMQVYRRVFGYSALLNEVILTWDERIANGVDGEDRRERMRIALLQGIRVGVRCVLRDGNWGYASVNGNGTGSPCAAIAEDLDNVLRNLTSEKSEREKPLPVSFGQFRQKVPLPPRAGVEGLRHLRGGEAMAVGKRAIQVLRDLTLSADPSVEWASCWFTSILGGGAPIEIEPPSIGFLVDANGLPLRDPEAALAGEGWKIGPFVDLPHGAYVSVVVVCDRDRLADHLRATGRDPKAIDGGDYEFEIGKGNARGALTSRSSRFQGRFASLGAKADAAPRHGHGPRMEGKSEFGPAPQPQTGTEPKPGPAAGPGSSSRPAYCLEVARDLPELTEFETLEKIGEDLMFVVYLHVNRNVRVPDRLFAFRVVTAEANAPIRVAIEMGLPTPYARAAALIEVREDVGAKPTGQEDPLVEVARRDEDMGPPFVRRWSFIAHTGRRYAFCVDDNVFRHAERNGGPAEMFFSHEVGRFDIVKASIEIDNATVLSRPFPFSLTPWLDPRADNGFVVDSESVPTYFDIEREHLDEYPAIRHHFYLTLDGQDQVYTLPRAFPNVPEEEPPEDWPRALEFFISRRTRLVLKATPLLGLSGVLTPKSRVVSKTKFRISTTPFDRAGGSYVEETEYDGLVARLAVPDIPAAQDEIELWLRQVVEIGADVHLGPSHQIKIIVLNPPRRTVLAVDIGSVAIAVAARDDASGPRLLALGDVYREYAPHSEHHEEGRFFVASRTGVAVQATNGRPKREPPWIFTAGLDGHLRDVEEDPNARGGDDAAVIARLNAAGEADPTWCRVFETTTPGPTEPSSGVEIVADPKLAICERKNALLDQPIIAPGSKGSIASHRDTALVELFANILETALESVAPRARLEDSETPLGWHWQNLFDRSTRPSLAIALTHPASIGADALKRYIEAGERAITRVLGNRFIGSDATLVEPPRLFLCPEAVAVAAFAARGFRATRKLIVLDVGNGTTDVAVLERRIADAEFDVVSSFAIRVAARDFRRWIAQDLGAVLDRAKPNDNAVASAVRRLGQGARHLAVALRGEGTPPSEAEAEAHFAHAPQVPLSIAGVEWAISRISQGQPDGLAFGAGLERYIALTIEKALARALDGHVAPESIACVLSGRGGLYPPIREAYARSCAARGVAFGLVGVGAGVTLEIAMKGAVAKGAAEFAYQAQLTGFAARNSPLARYALIDGEFGGQDALTDFTKLRAIHGLADGAATPIVADLGLHLARVLPDLALTDLPQLVAGAPTKPTRDVEARLHVERSALAYVATLAAPGDPVTWEVDSQTRLTVRTTKSGDAKTYVLAEEGSFL